jgi:uncharacterized integral membrane protein
MVTGRRLVVLAIFVALLVGGWSFATNHPTPVTVDYWFGQFVDVPLWLVLVVSFGCGAALVGVLAGLEMARMGLVARRYRSAIAGLEEEVHQLRNLPLAADAALAESEPTPDRRAADPAESRASAAAGGGGSPP